MFRLSVLHIAYPLNISTSQEKKNSNQLSNGPFLCKAAFYVINTLNGVEAAKKDLAHIIKNIIKMHRI